MNERKIDVSRLLKIEIWAIGDLNPGSQVFTFSDNFLMYVRRSFIRPALVDQASKPVNHFRHLEKI